MIYLFVTVLLLFFSFRYDICKEKNGYRFSYYLALIILISLAGFRWRLGLDTPSYIKTFYYWTPKIEYLEISNLSIGEKPLWRLLNSFVYTFFGRFYFVQLIQAAFVNTLLYIYFSKHTKYVFTSILFYFILSYYGMNMESMKASMSIVICLFANDYVLEKKWSRAYLLYFIAILWHPQALVLLLTPFIIWIKLNRTGAIILVFAFLFGLTFQYFFGDYLDLIEMYADDAILEKAEMYGETDRYIGQEGSLLRTFSTIYFPYFFLLFCIFYIKRNCWVNSLQLLEPLVVLGIVFMTIQMNSQIFYRYVALYQIYFIIYYSHLFVYLARKKRNTNIIKAFIVFLPLFLSYNARKIQNYHRFYPYSSIFDKTVDEQREKRYMESGRPPANFNEY